MSVAVIYWFIEIVNYYSKYRVALFGTATVAWYALYGTVKNMVAEPALFGTVIKKLKLVAWYSLFGTVEQKISDTPVGKISQDHEPEKSYVVSYGSFQNSNMVKLGEKNSQAPLTPPPHVEWMLETLWTWELCVESWTLPLFRTWELWDF